MSLNLFEETGGGIQLPHPPISLRPLLVIESALCHAWRLIREKPRSSFNLATADEDDITLELHERLYDEVFDKSVIDGFDKNVFASVSREPKIRNFNRTHPDKMPDLLFQFVDRPAGVLYSQHGVFTECKPVDDAHAVGSTPAVAFAAELPVRAWTVQRCDDRTPPIVAWVTAIGRACRAPGCVASLPGFGVRIA